MGNAPSQPNQSPAEPRPSHSSTRTKRPPPSPAPVDAPTTVAQLQTLTALVAAPADPPHAQDPPVLAKAPADTSLRPNRKSIDLPGLNTFAPVVQPQAHGRSSRTGMRVSSSRIVDRGRAWLHREGRGSQQQQAQNGARVPPRSAAIAIPVKKNDHEIRDQESGYGYHVREGIAKRKAAEKARRENEEPPRSPWPFTDSLANPLSLSCGSGTLTTPTPPSKYQRSPCTFTFTLALPLAFLSFPFSTLWLAITHDGRYDERRGRSYERHRPEETNSEREAREKDQYEQLYGPGPRAGEGQAAVPFEREVVFSTIPLTIGPMALIGLAEGDEYAVEDGEGGTDGGVMAVVDEIVGSPPPVEDVELPLSAVPIAWRENATEVYLIRAGDEDWMSRRVMERVMVEGDIEGQPTGPFMTTIHLPPGTHHFRFIVDGETVVAPATEIPNAVDDQGFIANYVAVPGPVGTTAPIITSGLATSPTTSKTTSASTSATVSPSASTAPRPPKRRRPSMPTQKHPDGSFWAPSTVSGSSDDVRHVERVVGSVSTVGGSWGGARGVAWTSEIPPELVRAAQQEEQWLDAQQQYQQAAPHRREGSRGRHIVLNGFVPEPSIPPAPRLPRHLERLILNRPSPGVVIPKTGPGATGSIVNTVGQVPSPALRITTASGTDVRVPPLSFTAMANGSVHASGTTTPNSDREKELEHQAAHPQFGGAGVPTTPAPSPGAVGVPLIADDPSVLQTPSHAVLYHLCTSSIRDKMIAVGASTRYRQKYLTTVYYKPAELEE
ncbi:5'-AMP-activated protein kinase beta subunit, interation domain-containing protein [Roridomyces roridus]|uniref:5'-AMP-activated protein kinase beta subunit, interation domain-containing protein n=1 Tax=Roridomyces roridus TaxID=1738132 RepID=A0AAD7CAC6_9AGAR|nr:5'-AMP-activated protein kinase beta subunit, interation domain-containing protein [Roridomyces roridus]